MATSSMTEKSQILGACRCMVAKLMRSYTQRGKTSSAKQNSGSKEKHSGASTDEGEIQKAFDRVWINGLTFKLITFKIPHPLIHLIHSYLTNRSFRIRINETLSNEHSVSAGCPQGSLLGPLLFTLYINDIPDYSLTKINLYADDTAIHATYKKLETISFALNKHLLLLQNFYDKWKISINVEKSTAIIFTKKQSLPPPIIMYNTQIPWSQEAKYLGIIFDTHLTWKQHIYYVRDNFRTIATPPGFHRPTNRHHATQQKEKLHFCHAQHHRLSRYGIEDCLTVQTPKRKRLFNAYNDEGERMLEKA
ncbi:probable RNA-directed DNA polymerase from transposon X-element [Trichonephila clavipes]|nr:probable RNA-directed DNA polymerase from transposon X-element [Trichonephila clavipes]